MSNQTPLSFSLALIDGVKIGTIDSAAVHFGKLSQEKREKYPWSTAILMLHIAMKKPAYLKVATINLQTALAMDGVLASPHPLDAR